jgi:hypothetical protein
MDFDGVAVDIVRPAVDQFGQLVALEHTAPMQGQFVQQGEFAR